MRPARCVTWACKTARDAAQSLLEGQRAVPASAWTSPIDGSSLCGRHAGILALTCQVLRNKLNRDLQAWPCPSTCEWQIFSLRFAKKTSRQRTHHGWWQLQKFCQIARSVNLHCGVSITCACHGTGDRSCRSYLLRSGHIASGHLRRQDRSDPQGQGMAAHSSFISCACGHAFCPESCGRDCRSCGQGRTRHRERRERAESQGALPHLVASNSCSLFFAAAQAEAVIDVRAGLMQIRLESLHHA